MNISAYRDMIYLSRPLSRHPKMSVENRAKLFAPFAALRGFDIEILTQEQDRLLVVLPEGHPLAALEKIPVSALCGEPFMLLEKGAKAEVSEIFERNGFTPRVHFTTWDDYAIMSMVESGLGISILPELILKRIPYRVVARELEIPAYRNIGLAWKEKKGTSPMLKRFMEYLDYR